MLAATGADDRSIRLWGLSPLVHQSSQRTQIAVLHGHGGPVTCLEVMKGEGGASRLLSGSTDGKVKLWDLASASCAWTLKCSMPIERLKITTGTEQEYLLAAGNSIWKLLDVRNARAAHALSIEQSGGRDLHCLSQCGYDVVVGTNIGTLVYDLRLLGGQSGNAPHRLLLQGHVGPVS